MSFITNKLITVTSRDPMNPRLFYALAALVISGCAPTDRLVRAMSSTIRSEGAVELPDTMKPKTLSDLDREIRDIQTLSIEMTALKISQVDEWLYSSDEEKSARAIIDTEVDKLRSRIESELVKLTASAVDSPSGKLAAEKMSQVGLLLQFYPVPNTETQREKLEQLSASIVSASRRIEDIRRLRYNEWAITRIQSGLSAYRDELKVKGLSDVLKLVKTDRDTLITSCIAWLSPIDPAFLEPSVIDLYNYVFGLTRDAIGSDDTSRIRLIRGLASTKTVRKTPADF